MASQGDASIRAGGKLIRVPPATIRSGMDNREIARLLAEAADLMEIAAEDSFRIRSYRNAAGVVESYPESMADIARDSGRKLTDVPGIGKGIGGAIWEILERG